MGLGSLLKGEVESWTFGFKASDWSANLWRSGQKLPFQFSIPRRVFRDGGCLPKWIYSILSSLRNMYLKHLQWSFIDYAAAAAAKSLQVVSDSVRPHRLQPTRLLCPWDSPGKTTGVGFHFLLQCMKGKVKGKSLSHVWLSVIPWTAAHQAPLSLGFSRQEYWSGLPLPSPHWLWTVNFAYNDIFNITKSLLNFILD